MVQATICGVVRAARANEYPWQPEWNSDRSQSTQGSPKTYPVDPLPPTTSSKWTEQSPAEPLSSFEQEKGGEAPEKAARAKLCGPGHGFKDRTGQVSATVFSPNEQAVKSSLQCILQQGTPKTWLLGLRQVPAPAQQDTAS